MTHYNITITGKVQGVCFRASAEEMALLLGIKGFVENKGNDQVYCEAEGDDELTVKFIQWCHHGPEKAVVKYVSVTEGEMKNFDRFKQIR